MKSSVIALALASALALGSAAAAAPAAFAQEKAAASQPGPEEMQKLREIRKIEEPAARAAALKQFLAEHAGSALAPVARGALVPALVEAKAPTAELVAASEAALAATTNRFQQMMTYNAVAMELADRGEQLETASAYAAKALELAPADEDAKELRASLQDTLGWVQVRRGEHAKAIETLSAARAVLPNSQEVLYHLGAAYEKAGQVEQAIDAYIRSETVFLGRSDAAKAPLRALYQKQHGSLAGLDEKLAAAREASRREVAFESRRVDKPAPAWELTDLAGKPVKLADYKGKVVIMDFWGSWCPPCRAELPHFQALYDKYKEKGVVFLGMNWEQPGEAAERMKAVTGFMAANKYTFPVVLDHDRVAVEAYEVPGFPTVFMIDKAGTIRYRNIGYEEGVEQILEAQLESLMK